MVSHQHSQPSHSKVEIMARGLSAVNTTVSKLMGTPELAVRDFSTVNGVKCICTAQ